MQRYSSTSFSQAGSVLSWWLPLHITLSWAETGPRAVSDDLSDMLLLGCHTDDGVKHKKMVVAFTLDEIDWC